MQTKFLSIDEQYKIHQIAENCVKNNETLDFSKAYVITLFYFLMQFCHYKVDTIPSEYSKQVQALYKEPGCSYIHYWNKIKESQDEYVKNIKRAEIDIEGGDPRCPW